MIIAVVPVQRHLSGKLLQKRIHIFTVVEVIVKKMTRFIQRRGVCMYVYTQITHAKHHYYARDTLTKRQSTYIAFFPK